MSATERNPSSFSSSSSPSSSSTAAATPAAAAAASPASAAAAAAAAAAVAAAAGQTLSCCAGGRARNSAREERRGSELEGTTRSGLWNFSLTLRPGKDLSLKRPRSSTMSCHWTVEERVGLMTVRLCLI
ncbi:uncharacterized protein LOC144456972 [Phascolarctos cinereus]